MRRKDREITAFDEIMKIIAKCDTCRVAMFDETFPYIIPLNFGTDLDDNQLYLYFHGAKIGKKIDLMKRNKNVSFESWHPVHFISCLLFDAYPIFYGMHYITLKKSPLYS